MAISTVIDVSLITDNVELNQNDEVIGTGIFDTLMETITRHIDVQYRNNKITGNEYATVYLGLVQTALSQAVDFAKSKDLIEAQITKAAADAEAAKAKADNEYALMLAEIDKVYGFSYTLDANDELVRSSLADTADGKMDYDRNLIKEKIDTEQLNNGTNGLLENQISKMQEDVTIAKIKTSLDYAEAKANADKVLGYDVSGSDNTTYELVIGASTNDGKLDAEVNLTKEKLDTELLNQQAVKAKVRDEYGREVDENGNDIATDSATLKHTHGIEKMKLDTNTMAQQLTVAEEDAKQNIVESWIQKDKAGKELGIRFTESLGDNTEGNTAPAGTIVATSELLHDAAAGTGPGNEFTNDLNTAIANERPPLSTWEANMRKALKEDSIAGSTAKGYEADSYYKQYKSLQELMFALANAGVITEADKTGDNVYSRIISAMEKNMNKQAEVWDDKVTSLETTYACDINGTIVMVPVDPNDPNSELEKKVFKYSTGIDLDGDGVDV